ncbi:right-handed parallel beta-helix repeat-containing protein [bacterium]|nr:right-handed parallel beta-helix repeat-containing protein [bacterium]
MTARCFTISAILLLFLASFGWAGETFEYQGRLEEDGQPYSGMARFYFGIYQQNGTDQTFLWTNSGAPNAELPPEQGVPVEVKDGEFLVEIGDVTLSNMNPLPGFLSDEEFPLQMRVWVDVGEGIQQLPSDRPVHVPRAFEEAEGDDIILYVDPITGDDNNTGKAPHRAKKTIQAAVDALPPVIRQTTRIQLADGVYQERVTLRNNVILGDRIYVHIEKNPDSTGEAVLRPAGTEQSEAFVLEGVSVGVNFRGLRFEGFSKSAIRSVFSRMNVVDCEFEGNRYGIKAERNSAPSVVRCRFIGNETSILVSTSSSGYLADCKIKDSTGSGLNVMYGSQLMMRNTTIEGSALHGLQLESSTARLYECNLFNNGNKVYGSGLTCSVGSQAKVTLGHFHGNGEAGVYATRGSYIHLGDGTHSIVDNKIGILVELNSGVEYQRDRVRFQGNGTETDVDSSSSLFAR